MVKRKRIQQHELLSKMEDYNGEMEPQPMIGPKVKSLTIITLIILALTFGVYYMGILDILNIKPSGVPSIPRTWVIGLINTLLPLLILFVVGAISFLLYGLYKSLVKSLS